MVSTLVTQSLIASLTASFNVLEPEITGTTLAPWQYYSYKFLSTNKWTEIKAPFSEFKKSNFYQPKNLSNQKMKSIGLVAGFENFKSDICLARIGFY